MKFLLLVTPTGKDAGPRNSSVLASFDHERHAIFAADIRMAKAQKERKTDFYYSAMEHDAFWAGVPHHKWMEPQ